MSCLCWTDSLHGDLRSGRLRAVAPLSVILLPAIPTRSGTFPAAAARSPPPAPPPPPPPPPAPPGPFPYFPGPQAPPPRRHQNTCRIPPFPITPLPGSDHAAPRGAHWPAAHGLGAHWLAPSRPRPVGARCILVCLRAPPLRPLPPRPPRPSRTARAAPGQSRAGGRRRTLASGGPDRRRPPCTCGSCRVPNSRRAAALLPPGRRHHAHAGLRGLGRRTRGEWPPIGARGEAGTRCQCGPRARRRPGARGASPRAHR